MPDEKHEPARFLNVDLVVDSLVSLDPLVTALGARAMVLYHGKFSGHWRAVLELALPRGPDRAIKGFAKLLSALPVSAQNAWKRAKRRVFDIGIRGGNDPQPLELVVSAEAARQAAALGASIQITVYAPVPVQGTRDRGPRDDRGLLRPSNEAVAGGRDPRLRSGSRR